MTQNLLEEVAEVGKPQNEATLSESSKGYLPVIFLNTHPIQYFAPLYRHLTLKGLQVQVLYCSDKSISGGFDKEFGRPVKWDIPLLEGYQYHFIKNYGHGKNGFFKYFNPGIISFLNRQPKSLAIAHSWNCASDIIFIIAARLLGHRVAFRGESNQAHERLKSPVIRAIKRPLLKFLFAFIHKFLYIGTQNKSFYQSFGVRSKKLAPSPYVVDNDRFQTAASGITKSAAREKLGLPANDFIVLYSGKYIPKKRPLDLLHALKRSAADHIFLLMMGEGELRGKMEEYIAEHQLSGKIRLTGFINQSELHLYYKAADLFVMCSDTGETWGLSVNEAMCFGLPVLLSHLTGCSADLVKQTENGFVFPAGDVRTLGAYLLSFSQMPAEQLEKMGEVSLEIINKFSFQQVYEGLLPLLRPGAAATQQKAN